MRKLFVMGGGGFAMEPENLALDRFILSLSEKSSPKVCFIGTASGDGERYRDNFYAAYKSLPCSPTHLSLFKPPTRDLESFVREQDIVHVGGGNTRNMLCLWKEWGLDCALINAYRDGLILTGMSAGMVCWFEQNFDFIAGEPMTLAGLKVIKGSACPHFGQGDAWRSTYHRLITEGKLEGGLALDDGAGALFLDERLDKCVSSRANARALLFETKTAAEISQEITLLS